MIVEQHLDDMYVSSRASPCGKTIGCIDANAEILATTPSQETTPLHCVRPHQRIECLRFASSLIYRQRTGSLATLVPSAIFWTFQLRANTHSTCLSNPAQQNAMNSSLTLSSLFSFIYLYLTARWRPPQPQLWKARSFVMSRSSSSTLKRIAASHGSAKTSPKGCRHLAK